MADAEPFTMPIMEGKPEKGSRFTWIPASAHRQQALSNHGQTLERLRERGGLAWSELEGVLEGIRWGDLRKDQQAAKARCLELYPDALTRAPA
jgi:hypothetical protein